MDMTDDQLIRQFMQDNIRVPEDNGFSQRVMRRLPHRPVNTAWTTVFEVVTLTIGLLLLLSRVDLTQTFCDISIYALQFVAYLRHVEININPLYIAAALTMLILWGGKKIKEA